MDREPNYIALGIAGLIVLALVCWFIAVSM